MMGDMRNVQTQAMSKIAKFLDVVAENVPTHRLPDKITVQNDAHRTELEMDWENDGTITVVFDSDFSIFATIDLNVPESIAITRSGLLKSLYINSGIQHVADLVYFELLPVENV